MVAANVRIRRRPRTRPSHCSESHRLPISGLMRRPLWTIILLVFISTLRKRDQQQQQRSTLVIAFSVHNHHRSNTARYAFNNDAMPKTSHFLNSPLAPRPFHGQQKYKNTAQRESFASAAPELLDTANIFVDAPTKSLDQQTPRAKTTEMFAMTAAGAVFTVGVLVALASVNSDPMRGLSLANVADNIVDATVPVTSTDVIAIALGEGLAGLLVGVSSFVLSTFTKIRQGAKNTADEAVADGDFLLAQAGALPLFEAIGLSPIVATVSSVVVATVPYELVKLGNRRKQRRQRENETLQVLLREQQAKASDWTQRLASGEMIRDLWPKTQRRQNDINLDTLKPVTEPDDPVVVEILVDVIKWLEFSVLQTDFSNALLWNGVPISSYPGAEGALFGTLATVSAQLYSDILYAVFGWGGSNKQAQVRRRTVGEWATVYLSRFVYAAVLFGVYEASQIPAQGIILTFLSGGVESCAGSSDFKMCAETFINDNPPAGASIAAEFRALVTQLVSLWNQIAPS